MFLCYNDSMNGNESSQKLNSGELTEEAGRVLNMGVGEGQSIGERPNPVLGREQARVIGSAMLSEGQAENLNDGQTAEQRLNAERVEQMVAAENKVGEEERMATAVSTVPEALIMPQVQGKIDKMMVKALGQLTEKEGNRPGMLDAKVNDLRRQYRVSWEMGR